VFTKPTSLSAGMFTLILLLDGEFLIDCYWMSAGMTLDNDSSEFIFLVSSSTSDRSLEFSSFICSMIVFYILTISSLRCYVPTGSFVPKVK